MVSRGEEKNRQGRQSKRQNGGREGEGRKGKYEGRSGNKNRREGKGRRKRRTVHRIAAIAGHDSVERDLGADREDEEGDRRPEDFVVEGGLWVSIEGRSRIGAITSTTGLGRERRRGRDRWGVRFREDAFSSGR
jgi:hypothetical protein